MARDAREHMQKNARNIEEKELSAWN